MRDLNFRSAYAENILCFGPKGVHFDFSKYGNVVQVKGINLDSPGTKDDPASNGAGKSSIQEILSIGLFGRTVKSPTKLKGGQIINALADKGHIVIEWDDYRLVRSFKKTSTGSINGKIEAWESKDHIWNDDTKITKGGRPSVTQEWIDERLGLNHHTFCNVAVFDDANSYSFFEADAAKKREFVENLLGLDQYRKYHDNAKNLLKTHKKSIEKLGDEYNLLCQTSELCDKRIQTLEQQEAQWKKTKQASLMDILARIKAKQVSLTSTNLGDQLANWQKGQDRIGELSKEIEDYEAKINKIRELLVNVDERLDAARAHKEGVESVIQDHNLLIKSAKAELDKQLKLISQLDRLEDGATCPVCYGVIKKDSYGKVLMHSHGVVEEQRNCIDKETKAIEIHSVELTKKTNSVALLQKSISDANGKIALFEGKIREFRKEISQLSAINKPEGNVREQVLEAEILELKKQSKVLGDELAGSSPYVEIVAEAHKEKAETKEKTDRKAVEIATAEEQVPYYQFWVEAFSERGIRRYVVDGIIPALNTRINYWLSYLIDGMIKIEFDNELEETITRKENPVTYEGLSKGEKRRVNLAVSQSFAYVMMLNSGCCTSLVFLDEITGGGIDRAGTVGVYNMIYELAKERQVFVTTHNENLMSMLQGCETLTLLKENDITVLSS